MSFCTFCTFGYAQTCFPCNCYMNYEYLDCYGSTIERYPLLDSDITTKLKVISLSSTFIRRLPEIKYTDYPNLHTFTDINNIVLDCEDVIQWYFILWSTSFTTKCVLPTERTKFMTDIMDITTALTDRDVDKETSNTEWIMSSNLVSSSTFVTKETVMRTSDIMTSDIMTSELKIGTVTTSVISTETVILHKSYMWAIYLSFFLSIILIFIISLIIYYKLRTRNGNSNRIENFNLEMINDDETESEYEIYSVV